MKVGIDILDISRVANARESFYKKVFTPQEMEYCQKFEQKFEHFAGIFCAKEAIMKALGFGMDTLSFLDIEILHDPNGKPVCALFGKAQELFSALPEKVVEISISHATTTATAICICI